MRVPRASRKRPAKTLALFALLLPVLFGLIGLVVDGGQLLATQRGVQNAADAAALAAAADLLNAYVKNGKSGPPYGNPFATAAAYVQNYNKLSKASVGVSIPPVTGPHTGDNHYVEVTVSNAWNTWFIQALGASSSRTVSARAVAGYESVVNPFGLAALDPTAVPGLQINGSGTLVADGVLVLSQGAGNDENSQWIDLGYASYALAMASGTNLQAKNIRVVGGVQDPARCLNRVVGDPSPLHAGVSPLPDPLKGLPVPDSTNVTGLTGSSKGPVTIKNDKDKKDHGDPLLPGVYDDISISGNVDVTFATGNYSVRSISVTGSATVSLNPGIFIVRGGGLSVSGAASLTGSGVMIYNTGSDYPLNGVNPPDAQDGENALPAPNNPTFGSLSLGGKGVTLSGPDSSSPFKGVVLYQRRRNPQGVSISAKGWPANSTLQGAIYAKWANVNLSGSASFSGQITAGSITIDAPNNPTAITGKSRQVFLVE